MNQTTLTQEIQKSREAMEALAEHDRLRAQAERLPELIREKAQLDAQERAKIALESAKREAIPKFADLATRAPKLRERLQALIASVKPLAAEIQQFQKEIVGAGRPLQSASLDYDRVHHVGSEASMENPDNNLPFELTTATRFSDVLKEAGATDPELDLMPAEGLPEWMRLLLTALKANIFYKPEKGAMNWRNRF